MKQNNLMSSRIQSTKEKENGNDPHTGIVSVLYYIRRSLFLPGFGDDLPKGGGKLFGRHGSCYLAQQVALGIEYEVGRDRPYAVFAARAFPVGLSMSYLAATKYSSIKSPTSFFEKTSRSIALQGPHQVAYKSMKTNLS